MTQYQKQKAEGKCTSCGKPNTTSYQVCESCRKKRNERQNRRRDERAANGICWRCQKNPVFPGTQRCHKCREDELKKTAIRRSSLKSKGLCRCGARLVHPGCSMCKDCVFKNRGRSLGLKPQDAVNTLASIWESQKGICPYTGINLTLDKAEIDHKLPKTQGGGHNEANLQWIHFVVNRIKLNLSGEEFLQAVKMVYEYCFLGIKPSEQTISIARQLPLTRYKNAKTQGDENNYLEPYACEEL